ncbi:hypothetical protein [Nonomuraea insulae]|uniref:Chitinase n=1 Tax=Nonomuraea insulae TaxID=1616787 RepID=A0ABW1CW32_9ACTN
MLPRPLAVLGAIVLTAGTAVAIRLLPAGAAPPPRLPVARPAATPTPEEWRPPPAAFVTFVDTAREPGFDLPAEFRRTGVRRYALGHLVAGGDGCAPKWTGPPAGNLAAGEPAPSGTGLGGNLVADESGPLTPDESGSLTLDGIGPGRNPVARRIGRLRAMGGDAAPVLGGPGGRELAATCTRPGVLTAAYRQVVGAFGAAAVDFEVRDSADRAAVLRRARAIRAVQREQGLRVGFTLPLRRNGLAPADVAMLRVTHRAGAEVGTVNLLAPIEPRAQRHARLGRVALAVREAAGQIARAQDLGDPGQVWGRVALTPVLADKADLSELDARKLSEYVTRHGLAWLSLRGVTPKPDVSRILWHTPP